MKATLFVACRICPENPPLFRALKSLFTCVQRLSSANILYAFCISNEALVVLGLRDAAKQTLNSTVEGFFFGACINAAPADVHFFLDGITFNNQRAILRARIQTKATPALCVFFKA